jgi:hypothetical protein
VAKTQRIGTQLGTDSEEKLFRDIVVARLGSLSVIYGRFLYSLTQDGSWDEVDLQAHS